MRKYQQIWNLLKEKGTAVVSVPDIRHHSRVVRGVIKEKHLDTQYKMHRKKNKKGAAKLCYKIKGITLIFTLSYSVGLADVL